MRAFDTNILLRLIVRDDADQVAKAEALLDESFLLLPTVILETVWALGSIYELPRDRIVLGIRQMLGHVNATALSGDVVGWALDRYELGGDFADMLHVAFAGATEASVFATFDRRVARYVNQPEIQISTL